MTGVKALLLHCAFVLLGDSGKLAPRANQPCSHADAKWESGVTGAAKSYRGWSRLDMQVPLHTQANCCHKETVPLYDLMALGDPV